MGNSSLKQKTALGLFWAAFNNGAMQILNAVIGIFLARLLLPADYGLVGMLTIFTTVAATLQESGFTAALVNIKKPTDNDYNSVFWFCNIVSVFLFAILFFCAPLIADFFHQPKLVVLARVVFLTLPLSAIGTVPSAYLTKYLIVKPVAIQRIIILIISGIVGITMAFKGMAYWSLVAQQITYIGLQGFLKFFLIPWRPSFRIDFTPIKSMFAFSSKILVTNVINQINNNILTVVFGRLFPVKVVGNFTQAYKWNNMASSFITGTVGQVSQTVFVATSDDDNRQLAVLRKMIRFTAFIAFPCMFGLAIISKEFIILLISNKWIDSVPILQMLCISGAFLPLYNPLQNIIISRGRSNVYMWLSIIQIAIQTALILIFASYGILFMVGIYSLFIALWTIAWYCQVRKFVNYAGMMFAKDIFPFLLTSLLACAIAFIIGGMFTNMFLSLLIKIVIAVVLYYAVMKAAHAQIMKECIDYLLKKKRS